MRTRAAFLAAALAVAASGAVSARTDCNRACLTGVVDTYLKALAANTPARCRWRPRAR